MKVTEESIARDVCCRVDRSVQFRHGPSGAGVERSHDLHGAGHVVLSDRVTFQRGAQNPRSDRLGQNERVTRPRPGVVDDLVRMYVAHDHHAVLGFAVVDRMTTEDKGSGFAGYVDTSLDSATQQLEHRGIAGPRNEVQGEQGPRPHRVDIAERVGGGDGPEIVRIVHNRRKKVHRHHHRPVVSDLKHRCIIARGSVDQHPWVVHNRHVAQDLRQLSRAEFTGSTGAV